MSKTGYIYEIYSLDKKMRYFGSTTQQVCKRIGTHNQNYNSWKKNGKKSFTRSYLIFETGEWNYKTIEKVVFDDLFELKNRERYYIENNDCVNNKIPNRSQKEYYEQNKEEIIEKTKEYREANKDKIDLYKKEWYDKNKDKILEHKKKKVTCDCGCIVRYDGLQEHKKSKKHLKLLDAKNLNPS